VKKAESLLTVFVLFVIIFVGCNKKSPTEGSTDSMVTDIDGNTYQTVKIGNQVWMAKNLKVTHYRNGDPIEHLTDNSTWAGLSTFTGAYCAYSNEESNAEKYGYLYNRWALTDIRHIAPEGWHVPTDDDWNELEMYLGMSQIQADSTGWRGTDEGGKLKETGTNHWNSPNTGATNESGFTARPGGYRDYNNGNFSSLGISVHFWSVTQSDVHPVRLTWYRSLDYSKSEVKRSFTENNSGFSVRLIRD